MNESASTTRGRGRPPGSKTKRKEVSNVGGNEKGKKRKVQDGEGCMVRANAESKHYTRAILPGYTKKLPPAAQDLVEKALLDHGLAEAPADDARWTELYEELHRLIDNPPESIPASTSTEPTDEDDAYEWAPSSISDDEEPPSTLAPSSETSAAQQAILPNSTFANAVHRYISHSLTKKGALPKDIPPESWDPNSLAAMSILVEELTKSQAKFNAQRTMFAKSPRNQALAAKREAKKKQGKQTDKDQEKEQAKDNENNTGPATDG